MAWRIKFSDSVAGALRKLDPQVARQILSFLHDRIAPLADQRSIEEALRGKELADLATGKKFTGGRK